MAHINGVGPFWALLKRGYCGTFHHFSNNQMLWHVGELATCHNRCAQNMAVQIDQSVAITRGGLGYARGTGKFNA